jgi:trans-aconitate 2-methyltransferase
MTNDTWNPEQYERFKRERSQPFFDLVALIRREPAPRVVDLGCGTGELTATLHRELGAARTVGIDRSEAMLKRSTAHAGRGLAFELGDIASFRASADWDVVFSNAALHWLPDHQELFARLYEAVAPGGQLAVHMPANQNHATHLTAAELASEAPFRDALAGYAQPSVLAVEEYARLLHRVGFREQHVRIQVYGHLLESREQVVEWVKGSLLTDYQKHLGPELFVEFAARYRERLLARLADERPYFFTFRRILLWGAK